MIVPMLKYSFVVYYRDYPVFLQKLQEAGVVHVIEQEIGVSHEVSLGYQEIARIKGYISLLQKRKPEAENETNGVLTAKQVLTEMQQILESAEQLKQREAALKKEANLAQPWGAFDHESLTMLAAHGYKLHAYVCPAKKFDNQWEADFFLEKIGLADNQVYFVIIAPDGTTVDVHAEEVILPSRDIVRISAEQAEVSRQQEAIEKRLDEFALAGIPALEEEIRILTNGLQKEQALWATRSEANDSVKVLCGWVPESGKPGLMQLLEQEGVLYIEEPPSPDERVPILLKNNKFAKLFESIGSLYSLPAYQELDLTPFFAPFFLLFFGFCMGDAGYGMLLVLFSFLAKRKVKKELRPVMTLAFWLGLSTIVFGAIGGTFFGINLIDADIPWLSQAKNYMLKSENFFQLALILGAVQILFGMALRAVNLTRQKGFAHALSTIGWILLAVGAAVYFLYGQKAGWPITVLYVWLGITGFPILFLNQPGKNPLINLGSGIWDIYSTGTGFLGDLLSYIRLFALGISSAILGFVFNDIAMQMGILGYIILLPFGHSLNLFMAALGSFVHPMRLTFVEFYKNAGFAGGGKEYKPFREV